MLTEWQVYRMFDSRRGAWGTFQFLVRERLLADGLTVGSDGSVTRLDLAAISASRRQAELALLRGAHRRQRVVLDVLDVGPEALLAGDGTVLQDELRALRTSCLRSFSRQ